MRKRIIDIANTLLEVATEVAFDLVHDHLRHRLGVPALEQRITELERHVSQAALTPRVKWGRA